MCSCMCVSREKTQKSSACARCYFLFTLFGLSVSDSPSVVLGGIEPELSFSHALVSEKECSYWHFKAQGITSSCQYKGCCQGEVGAANATI